jgi:hypothetical protein
MDEIITSTPNLASSSSFISLPTQQISQPSNDNGILAWIKWFIFNRYVLIILILSFLGLNLFSLAGDFMKFVTDLLRPIAAIFGYTIGETVKETVKIAKKGSKGAVNITADTLTGGIDIIEKGLMGKKIIGASTGGAGTGGASTGTGGASTGTGGASTGTGAPIPDYAGSLTQANKAKTKAGFCYIGEDRGFRSCIQVNDSDSCMSGDIFPTKEICINPTLRQ